MRERALDELADRCRGTLVLTASSANQVSECTPPLPDPEAQSNFVTNLLSALQGEFGGEKKKTDPKAVQLYRDSVNRGQVTASQVLEYLNSTMVLQRPVYLNANTALKEDFPITFL
mmetsp:Transcript_60474/g.148753  ORF Transcript_60474/g.148753 Transcript_60474/m.148753 type:complete len:116 (+) Transcript_60474:110-457(+)